jgi:hypothetical protein
MEQTFEGRPYYGPSESVLGVLENVTAAVAVRQPPGSVHSIWEIVAHLTTELDYAREVVEGTAKPFGDTWPAINDRSEAAWQEALKGLKEANRSLVRAVRKLDDTILGQQPIHVRGPFYLMLHGTMQHNVYHAGQISLLARQATLGEAREPK